MLEQAKDKLNEAAGAGEEALGKGVDSPKHQINGNVRKQLARGSYAIDDCIGNVKAQARRSPMTALAIAAGIGFVLGKLLTRK